MEADVLDSKHFFLRTLSVDTRFRTRYSTTSASDFVFHLPDPLKNIIRIRLLTAEIPLTENVISTTKDNNTFIISDGNGEHLITVQSGNYSLSEMIAAIQGQLNSMAGMYRIVMFNNRVKISAAINFTLDFSRTRWIRRVTDWGLGFCLGFRNRLYDGKNTYIGEALPNLRGEAYYFLEIKDMNGMNSRGVDDSNLEIFTKIFVDRSAAKAGAVIFDNNSNMMRREYVHQMPVNIAQMRMRLLDAYGEPVDLEGADYSLTFELTEITDFKDYKILLNSKYK
jgi:hypothetical protein